MPGWPDGFWNNHPFLKKKVAKTVKKPKHANIKAQFECPKHLHQAPSETLKYLQQLFLVTTYLAENVKHLLKQKWAQNIAISLGYFIFSKNQNEPPKIAQLIKDHPIWSPLLSETTCQVQNSLAYLWNLIGGD